MKCKGCGLGKKLIKAHIIPEAFFTGLRDGQKPTRIISNVPGNYPKKSPIGVYDKTILCRDCEARFQKLDAYGHEILIGREKEQKQLVSRGNIVGYQIQNVDTELLKLFFIAVLWRASISTHQFFRKIELGPRERLAKAILWNELKANKNDFSYVLAKFDDDFLGRSILDPHPEKMFRVFYYRFYMYGHVLYLKAGPGATPRKWVRFIPADGVLQIVSRGNIINAKEYSVLKKAANNNKRSRRELNYQK